MAEEIQIYKVSGHFVRVHKKYNFTKYVRSIAEDKAIHKVLDLVSSQNLKRRKVIIDEVSTVTAEECPNPYMARLAEI